jgi:hypothetical protein
MASPLTNPSMTGCGTMRMNFLSRAIPTPIWTIPHRMTVGNR